MRFRRRDFEEGMNEELRQHMELYAADLVRTGISPKEAARRARMALGGINSVKEECREARGIHIVEEFFRQLRHAARMLRKSPGFTLTAVLILAVCLGANLTIFALIDSVLLRPLPFSESGRLVTVYNTYPKAGVDRDGSSLPNYYERRGRIAAFSSLTIYREGKATVGEPGSTERIPTMNVAPEFFETLGVGPAMGRAFKEEETTYQTDSVVILSDAYWRQQLNADPSIIGRSIRVNGLARSVVGILPANFRFLSSEARLYFPLSSNTEQRGPQNRHSGGNFTHTIARLKPGISVATAQSQIDAHNASVAGDSGEARSMADAGFRSIVTALHDDHVESIRPVLLLMQACVLALLLIGVVNLANLLLVRANGRVKELAVRRALGATRWHIASEVTIEIALLSLTGGLFGFMAGAGGVGALAVLGAGRLPLGAQISFDIRVGLAGLAAVVAIGMALAAPIAWFHLRGHVAEGMQSEARGGTSGHAAQRLRHGFIVAQIAMAFVLLAGASLLGLSLKKAMEVSPGFRPDHVLTGQIALPWGTYGNAAKRLTFTTSLLRDLTAQPGVTTAGVVSNVPLSGKSGKSAATVKGYIPRPGEPPRAIYSYGTGGDYFDAMGFTLQAGRFLHAADSQGTARVCVVDEDFARQFWPAGNPVGGQLWMGYRRPNEQKDDDLFTVVGVVGRAKQAGLTDDAMQGAVYYPITHRFEGDLYVAARTSMAPNTMALTLQKLVRQIDPNVPVNDVRPMEARISDSLATRRAPALLAGLFSGIALFLTAIGTYGVLSYAVSQRRREIGVRMALGARPEQIRSQFLSIAARLLIRGTVLGLIGAWLAGQAMQAVLFHVPPLHWATLGGVAVVMAIVCLVACLAPSHRASRISPAEALTEQ